MFGLGKPMTKAGRWVKKQGLSYGEFAQICDISKDTATKILGDEKHKVTTTTSTKIVNNLRAAGHNVSYNDLW